MRSTRAQVAPLQSPSTSMKPRVFGSSARGTPGPAFFASGRTPTSARSGPSSKHVGPSVSALHATRPSSLSATTGAPLSWPPSSPAHRHRRPEGLAERDSFEVAIGDPHRDRAFAVRRQCHAVDGALDQRPLGDDRDLGGVARHAQQHDLSAGASGDDERVSAEERVVDVGDDVAREVHRPALERRVERAGRRVGIGRGCARLELGAEARGTGEGGIRRRRRAERRGCLGGRDLDAVATRHETTKRGQCRATGSCIHEPDPPWDRANVQFPLCRDEPVEAVRQPARARRPARTSSARRRPTAG